MATISLCMIVKNEERVLRRCLDSICDLVDEIIVVDTGSIDNTKTIAYEYTDNVYDFKWINDFSAARNFSFSKCSMDYIYVADADEYLDEENRIQFKLLKDNIYNEIEIVQMMYETISHDTVLNVYKEYRPKLYKRLREFTWIDPIHETVRLDPLVFDSDIVVTHAPMEDHSVRDLRIFEEILAKGEGLSENAAHMYAVELYKCGTTEDLVKALPFFREINKIDDDYIYSYSSVIIARALRLIAEGSDNSVEASDEFIAFVSDITDSFDIVSEIFYEKGMFYISNMEYDKAALCFEKAVYNSKPILDIHTGGDTALKMLINACNNTISQYDEYKSINGKDDKMELIIQEFKTILPKYTKALDTWEMPKEDFLK